ncbi:hypothetical protein MiSe_86740 [Microseira wollei NIES-4236]|uniref:Uncharacterized protein n=1 Tax=Microseira wollei NIES-4236 TaxID=2530354 RepID=A0AAV3XNE8_9CYAN|nr:hypothetical protein MiSe_86740 [Microseira wollei NIES-4236]
MGIAALGDISLLRAGKGCPFLAALSHPTLFLGTLNGCDQNLLVMNQTRTTPYQLIMTTILPDNPVWK